MRSVLVGSDLGPRSDAVVRGAAALASGCGATLHVVHALGWIGMPLREAVTALEAGADRRASRALEEQAGRVTGRGSGSVLPAVEYGCPPLAILERAKDLEPGVVVLGAAGPPGAREPLSGTTFRVAARSPRPVLVLRGSFHWPPRSVLYPVQGVDASGDGLRHAGDWLHRACPAPPPRQPMELLALHAAEGPDAAPDRAAALAGAARRVGRRELRVTGIRDPRHGRPPATAAEHVLDWAGRVKPDLILLHRHAGDAARVQDRTWYRVLLRSPCPVCLLPGTGEPAARPADTAGERAPEDDGVLASSA